jgi:hypothetical protein
MLKQSNLCAALAAAVVLSGDAAKVADKIAELPGYGVPKTDQYSGYLSVDDPQGKMEFVLFLTCVPHWQHLAAFR